MTPERIEGLIKWLEEVYRDIPNASKRGPRCLYNLADTVSILREKAEQLRAGGATGFGKTNAPESYVGSASKNLAPAESPGPSTQTDPDERFSGTISGAGEHSKLFYAPKDKMPQCPHTMKTGPSPGSLSDEDERALAVLGKATRWIDPPPELADHIEAVSYIRRRLAGKEE